MSKHSASKGKPGQTLPDIPSLKINQKYIYAITPSIQFTSMITLIWSKIAFHLKFKLTQKTHLATSTITPGLTVHSEHGF